MAHEGMRIRIGCVSSKDNVQPTQPLCNELALLPPRCRAPLPPNAQLTLSPPPNREVSGCGVGDETELTTVVGAAMDRRRPHFSQFMRPTPSSKTNTGGGTSGRSEREASYLDRDRDLLRDRDLEPYDRDRDRDRDLDRQRDRDRDLDRPEREPRSALRSQSGGGEEPELLMRQNQDLRRRLDEESLSYKKRLDTYKQAQAHQSALVSRLQAKILQYKQRCADLENQADFPVIGGGDSPAARGSSGVLPLPPPLDDHDLDPESALRLLDEERRRSERLKQMNAVLKQQLDEAHAANEGLTTDLQKLHGDWERLRDEMLAKEEEWKEEEQAFHDYYSHEHSRLIGLWREVASVKRQFSELRTSTERDLGRTKDEMNHHARDLDRACSGIVSCAAFSAQTEEKLLLRREQEAAELAAQVCSLRSQLDAEMAASRQKEERIQELSRQVRTLENRCTEADQSVAQVIRLQEEAELLQGALRDIAHAVIQDAESRDHLHLTPATAGPQRSPRRAPNPASRMTTSPAFAESTISAVQAALHKYQLQIHELQVKLETHREQCSQLKKQYDTADEAQHGLSARVADLTAQLDATRAQCGHLQQEKELFAKAVEALRVEKSTLDKTRAELASLVDTLQADLEKQQKGNMRLQKLVDSLEDDKIFLQNEMERLGRELALRDQALRSEEDRCSRLRDELVTTREELSQACLDRDVLHSQKLEVDAAIALMDKGKGDIELELERALLDIRDLQDTLEKAEAKARAVESEKKRLLEDIARVEADRTRLQGQSGDQQGDLMSLRKEILTAEQIRLDLESERANMLEKCKFLEVEKDKLEGEAATLLRERGELSNQLAAVTRKRDALTEDNVRLRQRLEQASETNGRINRNLEDLVKDCEQKQITVETQEKELQRVQEQLASIRTEKDALEAVLFDTQTSLSAVEVKRCQLEKDKEQLMVQQEALRGQISRLSRDFDAAEQRAREASAALVQQLRTQEAEYQNAVANLRKLNEEHVRKVLEEKEQIRVSLEKRLASTMEAMSGEKEKEVQQLQERISALQQHIDNLCQQHEEVLLRAENDKQQALLLAHHDQQALAEKLGVLGKELEFEKATFERVKRESASRAEQDRVHINSLREELATHKTRLEELRMGSEEEKSRIEARAEEARCERDAALAEAEELKCQLHLAEERNDTLQQQFQDTSRRLKESETCVENLRKELTDVKRQLSDSNLEKEKYSRSNKELRDHVKRAEGEKRETQRALDDAIHKISSLEDAKASTEAERMRLQGAMKEIEKQQAVMQEQLSSAQAELSRTRATSSNMVTEDKERQARLCSEIEERERAQQELHQLKKQAVELDSSLEIARQELLRLRARADEEDSRWRRREQELLLRLEDARGRERKLEDQKHNLEVCLADATQQIQELKARLGGTEGRVKALEQQLQQLETAKKAVEHKLSSVASTLRRVAGIQLDGSFTLPCKLVSPSRRWSPARSHDHHRGHGHAHCHEARDSIIDIDPEAVRKGVRALMQQVAHIERERDDLKTVLTQMKKQLNEASELQNKGDSKLSQALHNLRILQEEKGSLEAKLGQKQAALQAQNAAAQEKCQEVQDLREKMAGLELAVRSGAEEKAQYEEKVEKLRSAVTKLEGEKRTFQEELSRAESRATKLELHRMSLEGDLQRVQIMFQDKEAQIQKLQEKCEVQARTISHLEERCGSLKATVEQLNASMERAASCEVELRGEIAALQRTLQDANANVAAGSDKLKHLQKQLNASENERRVLVERVDAAQQSLADTKRLQQQLQDQVHRLQNELSNCEVQKSGLETQLRLTGNNQQNDEELMRCLQASQRELADLRSKADSLNDKIRSLEAEKRSLERSAVKAGLPRSKSFERTDDMLAKLEQENQEMRLKIRRLETQLSEKEAELLRLRSHKCNEGMSEDRARAAQQQADRLLNSRDQTHRQQVARLENQIQLLKEQLNQEVKRRQLYVLRSSRTGREVEQIRQALGDSLRTVAQDPQLDSILLESETRRLDNSMTHPDRK